MHFRTKPLHFLIEAVLAKGATGMVFKAQDNRDNRVVALKVLHPEYARGEDDLHEEL